MDDLDSVRVKIARASEHLGAFQVELNAFRKLKPYTIVAEIDQHTGEQIWKVASDPIPPPTIPAIGDALYNFRSALDHLAYQLVLKNGGTPTTATEFPIFQHQAGFLGRRGQQKMNGMNQAMKDLIQKHQPCFGTNRYRNRALWSLQEYGNLDKHRAFITVGTSYPQTMLWDPPGGPSFSHPGGPVQKETVLARFPATDMKSYVQVMPSIAFNEPPAAGEDIEMLFKMIELVVTSIVNEFEQAFFP